MFDMEYDVLVVGAGHNGLVAACYLARAGLKVAVIEAHDVVGGACVTEAVFPNTAVSTGDVLVSLFSPQIAADLNLWERGLQLVCPEVALFAPSLDGSSVLLFQDPERTAHELTQTLGSQREAEAYLAFEAFLDHMEARLAPWWMREPPNLEELAYAFRGSEGEGMLRDLLFSSVADLLDGYFQHEGLKAALGVRGVLGSFAGPRTPGTAYTLITQSLGRLAGRRGAWAQVVGGTGRLSAALAQAATENGVRLVTGQRVVGLDVHQGRVRGVHLASGLALGAASVLSCTDPRTTFLQLLAREHLPSSFVRQVEKVPMQGVVLRLELLLRGVPEFRACPGGHPGPHHHGMLVVAPSLDYMHLAFGAARIGQCSAAPIITGYLPTLADPTLAPAGYHLMSLDVQYAPYHLVRDRWEILAESYADHVLGILAQYAPNLPTLVVERRVCTPKDREARFGTAWGHPHHGDLRPGSVLSFRPVPGWAGYRTPIRGLYLCGAGAHPGGGISGLPGRNAAYALLEDLSNPTGMAELWTCQGGGQAGAVVRGGREQPVGVGTL